MKLLDRIKYNILGRTKPPEIRLAEAEAELEELTAQHPQMLEYLKDSGFRKQLIEVAFGVIKDEVEDPPEFVEQLESRLPESLSTREMEQLVSVIKDV